MYVPWTTHLAIHLTQYSTRSPTLAWTGIQRRTTNVSNIPMLLTLPLLSSPCLHQTLLLLQKAPKRRRRPLPKALQPRPRRLDCRIERLQRSQDTEIRADAPNAGHEGKD
jgi:hypothetical protein